VFCAAHVLVGAGPQEVPSATLTWCTVMFLQVSPLTVQFALVVQVVPEPPVPLVGWQVP